MVEFKEWPKIPRGHNEIITITEKIDGTNACVIVHAGEVIGVQSRTQLLAEWEPNIETGCGQLVKKTDNYGFAEWVMNNKEDLALKLDDGYHYGEWAGPGIQKNPHNLDRKTFFLFNSDRWRDGRQPRPAGVECVPVLYEGTLVKDNGDKAIDITMQDLWLDAKNFGYHPEGIVVWYHKTRRYEKYTFENANGKWAA